MRHGVRLSLFVLIIGLLAHTASAVPGPTLGGPAPSLKEAVWIKGGPLPDFEPGRIYVVDLWATWCKPCLESMPALHKLETQYKNQVTFVALSIWDPEKSRVVEFVEKHGERMPSLIATDFIPSGKEFNEGLLATRYLGTTERVTVPRTYIIDQTGKLVWIGLPRDLAIPLGQVVKGTWSWSNFAETWVNDMAPKTDEILNAN